MKTWSVVQENRKLGSFFPVFEQEFFFFFFLADSIFVSCILDLSESKKCTCLGGTKKKQVAIISWCGLWFFAQRCPEKEAGRKKETIQVGFQSRKKRRIIYKWERP